MSTALYEDADSLRDFRLGFIAVANGRHVQRRRFIRDAGALIAQVGDYLQRESVTPALVEAAADMIVTGCTLWTPERVFTRPAIAPDQAAAMCAYNVTMLTQSALATSPRPGDAGRLGEAIARVYELFEAEGRRSDLDAMIETRIRTDLEAVNGGAHG